MKNKIIRFGSRKSLLALAQTKLIMESVARAHPELTLELVTMETTGDRNMKPFSETSDKFGIKGLFTQELEESLHSGAVDVAVHSLKDVPMNADPTLPIVAYSKRGDPRDVLVAPCSEFNGGVIGCSSARRRVQLRSIFPESTINPVRGNVNTRLRKLDEGEFDALVLAAAGLCRLGLDERITRYFSPDEMIPAPGQAVIACQGRADEDYWYLDAVRDEGSAVCASAERTFSARLGGGCTAPVAAFARIDGNEIILNGLYADENENVCRGSVRGKISEGDNIAAALAQKLLRGESDE